MTPEAYYSKLQKASLWQGALTKATPAVVEAASLIVKPYELTQAENALKKRQAAEKGIPLDVQQGRIDSAVGRTQQTVNAQLRGISDQLAMNPPPAKRKQLMAQQRKLTGMIGTAETQAAASVGAQSTQIAQQQVAEDHRLEDSVAQAQRERREDIKGAFVKGISAAADVAKATRTPPDYGTFLAESRAKAEAKGKKFGTEITGLESDKAELMAGLEQPVEASDLRLTAAAKGLESMPRSTTEYTPAEQERIDEYDAAQAARESALSARTEGEAKGAALSEKIAVLRDKRKAQSDLAATYGAQSKAYQGQVANMPMGMYMGPGGFQQQPGVGFPNVQQGLIPQQWPQYGGQYPWWQTQPPAVQPAAPAAPEPEPKPEEDLPKAEE